MSAAYFSEIEKCNYFFPFSLFRTNILGLEAIRFNSTEMNSNGILLKVGSLI